MTTKTLSVIQENKIATVLMERPECGNALSLKLMGDLTTVRDSFKYDTETCVVIIKGQGRHCCVGADLKNPDREPTGDNNSLLKRNRVTQVGRDLISSILNLNQIRIAAVQGAAAGGGACITTACDFRIGTMSCSMAYSEGLMV